MLSFLCGKVHFYLKEVGKETACCVFASKLASAYKLFYTVCFYLGSLAKCLEII